MPIDVKCPQCGGELEAPDNAAGRNVKCPDCGTRIAVPSAEDEPTPPAKEAIQTPPGRPPAGGGTREEDDRTQKERPRRRRQDAENDEEDGDRPRRRRRRKDDEADGDDGVSTLIPYKNGKALAAYYCGVFSFIPCVGNVLGPLAVVFGILGLRYVKERPSAKGTGHAWAGIVMGTLTILAWWVVPGIAIVAGVLSH